MRARDKARREHVGKPNYGPLAEKALKEQLDWENSTRLVAMQSFFAHVDLKPEVISKSQ